jgi:RNA polymerase sigma-70 factor (ECF subfamily)
MLRVARLFVRSDAVAEDVVQETWIQFLRAIDKFEGRSSLRTWIFAILANCARRRAERESHYVSLASHASGQPDADLEDSRFFPADHPRWAGMWTTLVDSWSTVPERELMSAEARRRISEAIESLPPNHATVFTLRDVEGWESGDVCALLGISMENQRVLLHRARSRVRAALEQYFERGADG